MIEVETNKATMNVSSPCPGKVARLLVRLNESYPVGAVLGLLGGDRGGRAPAGTWTSAAAGKSPRRRGRQAKATTMGESKGATDRARFAGAGACGGGQLHVAAA